MIATEELLSRALEYRDNIAPGHAVRNPLSHEEEMQHLQIKSRIVDRLAKECGSSLDDRQLFTVAVTGAMQSVSSRLQDDALLEAVFADLAASVELACRSPVSDVQLGELSQVIRRAGDRYYRGKYFVHAAACYSQSQRGFRRIAAFDDQREAEYRLRLSAWRASKTPIALLGGFWSNLLFGFGFRPYRVLWAMLAVILLFGCAYCVLASTHQAGAALLMSAYGYFGMLGKADLIGETAAVRLLVVLQGFLSVVLNATLVALLAKRWFRL